VTFTVAVEQGWASMVGTVFAHAPSASMTVTPSRTVLVFDPSTGEIRHTVSTIVVGDAEPDGAELLREVALVSAQFLAGDDSLALETVISETGLRPGRGYRVDPRTRTVVPQRPLDLPDRPWLVRQGRS